MMFFCFVDFCYSEFGQVTIVAKLKETQSSELFI